MITSLAARSPDDIATTPSASVVNKAWEASWIGPFSEASRDYGVHHFRRSFELERKPKQFVVNVSADNRYRMFVNGAPVHIGPARGDLEHWRFDTLDIAQFLQKGRNVLAVKVWNFGEVAPVAQQSIQTAFILQGDSPEESVVNTDQRWVVMTNKAYRPITGFGALLWSYYAAGPGDDVDASEYPWGWEQPGFDDQHWAAAHKIDLGTIPAEGGAWKLTPRQIPLMESGKVRFHAVRGDNVLEVSQRFLEGKEPLLIPANSKVELLLDQGKITVAYPELDVSGGRGSSLKLTYAEALFEAEEGPDRKAKGNRDVVEGKHMRGNHDIFRPDGGKDRIFRPLRWRTYRYVLLEVETGSEPLVINDFSGDFTAYPFVERGTFKSADADLEKIWDLGWYTLRVGTHEIFTDCPYYEQLCYVGDTRIQAIIALYVSGDDRLVRKVIEAFDLSRQSNGLTRSRWPDRELQIIPPYSLFWVNMVHDYWQLRDDPEFIKARLTGIRDILRYFDENSLEDSGSYTATNWWNFVDWINAWGKDPVSNHGGVPPRDVNGSSAILDLQLVYTLQHAAELFNAFGDEAQAKIYVSKAQKLRQHVVSTCWDDERGLLGDTSDKETFSQHAQSLLILTAGDKATDYTDLASRMMSDPSLTQATVYFSFYPHRALAAAGLGDQYIECLGMWRSLLDQGLSTIPETPSPRTRSDAHAWGAHPIIGMLETVCGIQSGEPGFKSVRIRPNLNGLPFVHGSVVHPKGMIEVYLRPNGEDGLTGSVTLPDGVPGVLEWRGQKVNLQPGKQDINL